MGLYQGISKDFSGPYPNMRQFNCPPNAPLQAADRNNFVEDPATSVIARGRLTTDNDVSTWTLDSTSSAPSSVNDNVVYVDFSRLGTRYYILANGSGGSSPGVIMIEWQGTQSYSFGGSIRRVETLSGYGVDSTLCSFSFNEDGSTLLIFTATTIFEFNCSTAWSLSTISLTQIRTWADILVDLAGNVTSVGIGYVNWTDMRVANNNDGIIYQLTIDPDFNVSSITRPSSPVDTDVTDNIIASNLLGVGYAESESTLFVTDGVNAIVYQYDSLALPVIPPSGTTGEKASGDNYVTLTWMNSLGGWEYWTFTSRHSYGDDVQDLGIIERDIFQDWDSGFINGQSEREVLGKDVTPFTVLRSQALTKEQVDVIKNIRSSIKVQVVTDSGFTTVIVDAGSFTYRTDKEKNILIEFTIRYPRTQIQKL